LRVCSTRYSSRPHLPQPGAGDTRPGAPPLRNQPPAQSMTGSGSRVRGAPTYTGTIAIKTGTWAPSHAACCLQGSHELLASSNAVQGSASEEPKACRDNGSYVWVCSSWNSRFVQAIRQSLRPKLGKSVHAWHTAAKWGPDVLLSTSNRIRHIQCISAMVTWKCMCCGCGLIHWKYTPRTPVTTFL
jgi:hypothetical protein